jgi:hypothetical protein
VIIHNSPPGSSGFYALSGDLAGSDVFQAGGSWIRHVRELVRRSWRAILDTDGVAPTQITFEHLSVGANVDGEKGAGVYTFQTANATHLINHYGSCAFVHVHGLGHRASLFAEGNSAMAANGDAASTAFIGADDFEPCEVAIDRASLCH